MYQVEDQGRLVVQFGFARFWASNEAPDRVRCVAVVDISLMFYVD